MKIGEKKEIDGVLVHRKRDNRRELLKDGARGKAGTLANNPGRAKKDNIDLPKNVNQYSIFIIKRGQI